MAGTLTVGEDQDHATLAEAVIAAEPGDTLELVGAEHVGGVVISKALILKGAGADKTAITGSSTLITVTGDAQVVVEHLALRPDKARAISASSGALILRSVHVSGGRDDELGGGVRFAGDSLTIEQSTFEDNRALEGLGGHVYASNAEVVVKDSTFERGLARRGGAIYARAGTLEISGSTLRDNAVRGERVSTEEGPDIEEGMGGALAAESNSTVIDTCVFDGNSVELGRGGQINVLGGDIELTDVDVLNGSATERYGGGMATFSAQVVIEGGRFQGNTITTAALEDNDAANGAALFLHGTISARATITSTRFIDNVADMHGGAIRIAGGSATIDRATFSGNSGYFGGAVHVATPFEVEVTNSAFQANEARYGAAMRWRPPDGSQDVSSSRSREMPSRPTWRRTTAA